MDRSPTTTGADVAPRSLGEPSELVVAAPDPDEHGWAREPVGPDQVRNDAAVAGALLVGALLSMVLQRTTGFYEEPAEGWVALLCLAAATLPLALRRRYPSVVAVVITVAFMVTAELLVPETLFINITLFMALYTVGAWEPDRARATWVRLGIVVVMFAWLIISLFRSATDPDAMPDLSRAGVFSPLVAFMLIQLLTNILYFAGAYWFGDHAWTAARERARTAYRGRLLQIERQVVERQAVSLERLRLARELHDAVAHHVSMMGVQAAAARTLLGTDVDRAARALEQVEDSARQGIEELHGVLGMLRETVSETGGVPGGERWDGTGVDLAARDGRHGPDGVGSLS
ncbi:histidine kinase, partial [Actinotalea sp. C106]|uniref:sensor histidine kinase n=1 Tax=Actinotalea sp. C106 TaxID=2908644 RepID=UPI002027E0C6